MLSGENNSFVIQLDQDGNQVRIRQWKTTDKDKAQDKQCCGMDNP